MPESGSLFVTRPTIVHYTAKRADLEALGEESGPDQRDYVPLAKR